MVTVYQYSHGLTICDFDTKEEVGVVYALSKKYYSTKREIHHGKVKYLIDTIYSVSNIGYTKLIGEIFFSIIISRKEEVLGELKAHNIEYRLVDVPYVLPENPPKIEVIGKNPWEYQKYYIDYVLEPGTHKLIPIQTGKGKGTIMILSVAEIGGRMFIEAKKAYLGKLKRELVATTNLKSNDVLLIDSGKMLYKMIDKAVAGEVMPPAIMCGIHTLYGFVQDWCSGIWGYDFNSPYNPVHLFQILGVNTRVIDEAHQLFDMIYKIDLLTNVPKTIYMSATFDADPKNNALKARMQRFLIPDEARPTNMKPDAYTTFIKAPYRLYGSEAAIKKAEVSAYGYAHIKYEKDLKARKRILHLYFVFLQSLFEKYYINNTPTSGKPETKRCLFLFSTKNMCEQFTAFMKKEYYKLDIRKYTDEDPEENIEKGTIVISTWQSGGTAHDMPGLVTLINTVPIRAKETNQQIPGRLRNPKVIGLTMTPYYILAYNIDSQWQQDTIYRVEKILKPYMTKIIDLDVAKLNTAA